MWFEKLREFDSLSKMRHKFEIYKNDQESRITKLHDTKKSHFDRKLELITSIAKLNQELGDIELKIKSNNLQKERLINSGGDSQKITNYEKINNELEDNGFNTLVLIDKYQHEIIDIEQFLNGIDKTINEIKEEISQELRPLEMEYNSYNMRQELILEELPSEFKSTLNRVLKLKLAHGPFTKIENGGCYFCRFKVSLLDQSEIDTQFSLKTCTQCNRIFLPYGL